MSKLETERNQNIMNMITTNMFILHHFYAQAERENNPILSNGLEKQIACQLNMWIRRITNIMWAGCIRWLVASRSSLWTAYSHSLIAYSIGIVLGEAQEDSLIVGCCCMNELHEALAEQASIDRIMHVYTPNEMYSCFTSLLL
jgi:hypothetical protein